jgi:hypothetical protein
MVGSKSMKFYLYFPILFLFLFFLFTQIFSISFFKNQFLQTGNVVYYKHRPVLFEKLKKAHRKKEKKLAIAFGDSRAYSYSDQLIKDKPKWSIYNFSAPQAVPAYSLYWLENFHEASIKPDVLWFVISPEGFHDAKGLMFKPFLRMVADDKFVTKYWNHIPSNDRYEYLLDKLLPLRAIEFDYKLFLERYKKGNLKQYNPVNNTEWNIINLFNGEQLAYASLVNLETKLQKDSIRMANIYLYGYTVDETQFYYVQKFLEYANQMDSKVVLIWPGVYKDYYKEYAKYNIQEKWWNRIQKLAVKYSAITIDLNNELVCDKFYDASHQSVACFHDIISGLLDKIEAPVKK